MLSTLPTTIISANTTAIAINPIAIYFSIPDLAIIIPARPARAIATHIIMNIVQISITSNAILIVCFLANLESFLVINVMTAIIAIVSIIIKNNGITTTTNAAIMMGAIKASIRIVLHSLNIALNTLFIFLIPCTTCLGIVFITLESKAIAVTTK